MRKNFGKKSWLYPMPVLIVAAYDEQGVPNVMNAAWGGIFSDDMIGICLSEGHKTTKNIRATGAFTVSVATAGQLVACDYVGIVSGNKEPGKFAKAGFSAARSEFVNAPVINELPMALECELASYDDDSNHLVGRIVNVSADESVLTDGKIDVAKLRPVTYDPINHNYIELGAVVGKAFFDGKKLKG
ncbi:MAG: flavin reductase family protein [Bacteroidaceae bacterium]|nr:flavin reductase family protein [Bacteroidaceae bacterium]